MWFKCIGYKEWFHLHCSRIPPMQHGKLEQVYYIYHLLTLKIVTSQHCGYLYNLETILLLFCVSFAPPSPFSVNVWKHPLMTRNILRDKVAILLAFLFAANSKSLIFLALRTTHAKVFSCTKRTCSMCLEIPHATLVCICRRGIVAWRVGTTVQRLGLCLSHLRGPKVLIGQSIEIALSTEGCVLVPGHCFDNGTLRPGRFAPWCDANLGENIFRQSMACEPWKQLCTNGNTTDPSARYQLHWGGAPGGFSQGSEVGEW